MDSGFENSDFPADTDALGSVADKGQGVSDESVNERGGIVTARGTGDGLVIRLDGRIEKNTLIRALEEFLSARRTFLGGQEVSLEWVGSIPVDAVVKSIEEILSEDFGIKVVASRSASPGSPSSAGVARSLFDGARSLGFARRHTEGPVAAQAVGQTEGFADQLSGSAQTSARVGAQSVLDGAGRAREGGVRASQIAEGFEWDDPDARLIQATLRSGQKIESEHSVVILGDVNSGAEIVAGGDIIVLGSLRGVAHAGAYDETGGGRVIFALNLQPTQLRIGSIISRGAVDISRSIGEQSSFPEIARVEGALITVEPYLSKGIGARQRR